MAIINFEKIADGGNVPLPDGYRKLDWNNFSAVDDYVLEQTIPNTDGIRSGEAAAVNVAGQPADFKSPDRDDDFDFNSGHFTAFIAKDLKVKVFGFDDGERVAKQVLVLGPDRDFVRFGAQFDDIDEVRFRASGGTDANPKDEFALEPIFLIDDLFIDF